MLRGGHPLALSRAIVEMPPGHRIDHIYLAELRYIKLYVGLQTL